VSFPPLPGGVRNLRIPLPTRGGTLSLLDMGPADQPVRLMFSHANGFNARTYRSILEPLAETHRILLVDMRGHGRTALSTETHGRNSWLDLRDDLMALLDALDVRDVVLSGHSMGATTSLLATLEAPARVRGLVLFEPVILRPELRGEHRNNTLAEGALRRRRSFPDRAAALAAYQGRGPFARWTEAMLEDYVADGFRDAAEGVELSATPEWEYANYIHHAHDAWRGLTHAPRPVRILRAENASTCGASDADLPAMTGAGVSFVTVPGTTHFLPMERPDLVAEALASAL
jgi:pimeloyl-ACP methyl ester carboxylesterase